MASVSGFRRTLRFGALCGGALGRSLFLFPLALSGGQPRLDLANARLLAFLSLERGGGGALGLLSYNFV